MKIPIILCMIILAIDMGGTHSPLDRELRRIKRKLRYIADDVQTMKNTTTQKIATINQNLNDKINNIIDRLDNSTTNGPVEDPFYLFVCGYQNTYDLDGKTMTYDKLLINHTNIKTSGGLNPSSGIFKTPLAGIYSVNFNTINDAGSGDSEVVLYFKKNGVAWYDSLIGSIYTGTSGKVYDNMGKDLTINLEEGDTLELYCHRCNGPVYRTTICLTLLKPDDGTFSGLELDLNENGQVDSVVDVKKN